jgi:demethylmenaquinone methyltransferase/2-methoxy-6-polyprenyl-1,4-benzoquinol methylase
MTKPLNTGASDNSASRVAPLPVLPKYFTDESNRPQRVRAMFDASAPDYDWITSVMSFGSGRWYRRDALRRIGLKTGMAHLDVGAGTGVVALLGQGMVGPEGVVVAMDPSQGMLAEARAAGVKNAVPALGERLPCASGQFDLVTMGYALRHVADLRALFTEYARVLKPGGKVLVLEITRPQVFFAHGFLKFYMGRIVPLLARLVRRSIHTQTLMQFYWDTIEHCVPPDTIQEAMRAAGLANVRRHVIFGIFSEYIADKAQ